MPALENRERFEEAMAAALASLLHQQAIAALHGSDAVDWQASHSLTATVLLPSLIVIYMSAADQAARETGTPIDRIALSAAARQWAEGHADELAADLNAQTKAQLEQHEQEAVAQGVSIAVLILAAIPDLFGEDRARRVGVTQTTSAVTAGERFVMGDKEPVWMTMKYGVCDECSPLHGKPRSEWPEDAKDGPPYHEHCRCYLVY